MDQYGLIKEIFKTHNGIARTSDFTTHGIHSMWLNKLADQGIISKIRRGVYEWIETRMQDDELIIKRLFPDAIVCMNSALFHYGYIDRTPDAWHLAFNRDMNKRRLKINYPPIKPYYLEPHLLDIGFSEEVLHDTVLKIYDRDRAICDVLRHAAKIDPEILNKSIQSYVKDNRKNVKNLVEYAKVLRVYAKVQKWIGVWL